jgi:hypothetical protein
MNGMGPQGYRVYHSLLDSFHTTCWFWTYPNDANSWIICYKNPGECPDAYCHHCPRVKYNHEPLFCRVGERAASLRLRSSRKEVKALRRSRTLGQGGVGGVDIKEQEWAGAESGDKVRAKETMFIVAKESPRVFTY